MTTSTHPETTLVKESQSRSIRLEAPVPGTDHGIVHFTWSLDDGEDEKRARYSYWLWPDYQEKMTRRYSHGYRSWQNTFPEDVVPAAEALWSAWRQGAPDPEGTVRRDIRMVRTFAVTGVDPFTTFRNETFLPAQARVLWICSEDGDRSRDFCTVDLAPSGTIPSWESPSWTHGAGGSEYFNGNDVIPVWLAGLAESVRTDLLGTEASC